MWPPPLFLPREGNYEKNRFVAISGLAALHIKVAGASANERRGAGPGRGLLPGLRARWQRRGGGKNTLGLWVPAHPAEGLVGAHTHEGVWAGVPAEG